MEEIKENPSSEIDITDFAKQSGLINILIYRVEDFQGDRERDEATEVDEAKPMKVECSDNGDGTVTISFSYSDKGKLKSSGQSLDNQQEWEFDGTVPENWAEYGPEAEGVVSQLKQHLSLQGIELLNK